MALSAASSDEVICDPACGTSGFLVASGEYLKEKKKDEIFFDRQKKDHYMNHMFYGYDMDRTMLRIGAMNMMTHGIDNPFIEYRDSLSDQNTDKDKYTLVLANPPFKGSLDAESVSGDLLKVCKTKKTELLFLALFLRILKVGGRCACIVPDGVLFGSSTAHKAIRKEIVENQRLEAVISMRHHVHGTDTKHGSIHVISIKHVVHIMIFFLLIEENLILLIFLQIFAGSNQES